MMHKLAAAVAQLSRNLVDGAPINWACRRRSARQPETWP